MSNLHPVEAAALRVPHRIHGFELVRDVDIKVALVLVVRFVLKDAGHSLFLLNSKHIAQVEYRLLPVGISRMRSGGKANRLVACRKVNIEPRNQRMNEVVALGMERERRFECQLFGGDGVEINGQDWARIGY